MNETEINTQREEAIVQANTAKDILVTELSKYPSLKVLARWLYADTKYPKWNIQVSSTNEKADRFHDVTNICVDSARWSSTFNVSIVRHTGRGGRGGKRHYKAMTVETAKKIAKDAYEAEQLHIQCEISRVESDTITAKWQQIRHAKLKDFVIHPMMRISIIETGKEPTSADWDNPQFQVEMDRYSTPNLSTYRLTRSQVQELAACIARITGLGENGDNKFAVIRKDGDKVYHFDGHMLHLSRQTTNGPLRAKLYDTLEDAQKDVDMLNSREHESNHGAVAVPFSAVRF